MADDEAYVSGNLQSGFAGSDQVQASVATPGTALTLGGHAVELLPAAKSDPSAATAPSRSYKLPGIARAKGDPDSGPGSHAKGPTPGTAAATPTAQLASRFGKMLEATSPTSDYGSLSMPSLPSMSEETSAKQPPSLPSKSQTAPPSVVEKGAVSTEGGASVAHERPSSRTKRALEGRDTEEERLESGFVDDNVEAMEEEGEEPRVSSPQRTTPPPPSRPPPSSSPHPLLPSSHRHSLEGPPQWETKGEAVPEAVPPVGESVEVRTDTLMEQYLARPHTGREMKRGSDGRGTEFSATKTPRLANIKSAVADLPKTSNKAIRVSTIKSGPRSLGLKRGRGEGERSPERMEAQSPVAISMGDGPIDVNGMECEVRTEFGTSALPINPRGPRVGYTIRELSQSARPSNSSVKMAETLTTQRETRGPVLTPMLHAVVTDHTPFPPRRSPVQTESSRPSSSPAPLLSPHSSRQSTTPSPHSPYGGQERMVLQAGEVRSPSSDAAEGRSSEKEEAKKPQAQNALLQVSEAHLAILPDEDGDTPLHLSIIHENLSLTQYLVKLIVGVHLNLDIANNMRQTPLHLSVITRQPSMVQLLVSSGSSVNFPDRKGNTSTHLAAQRRDLRILQILSQATSPLPDYNCKNFAGLTAVHLATKEASLDVLKFLFQMGANKNAQDSCSGRSPLHYAVESENFTLVNYLLENSCNVNAATFSGNTPLHIAAGRRLKEIVALLMAYGANPAIANGEGDFPSDLPASLLMQRAKMNAH